MDGLCEPVCTRLTDRLKDPGVLPIMAYTGTAAGRLRPKGEPFSGSGT